LTTFIKQPDTQQYVTQQSHEYSSPYRWLHWTMAIGFILLLIAGQQFNLNLSVDYRISGLRLHSSLGSIVFIAALFLFIKRFIRNDSRPEASMPKLKKLMATGAQLSLYRLAVFIPNRAIPTAYFSELPTLWFGIFDISQFTTNEILFTQIRRLHELATFVAIGLVCAHAGAALYHHFVKKDQVLSSMVNIEWLNNKFNQLKSVFFKSKK